MADKYFLGALPTISTDDVPTYSAMDSGASGGSPNPSDEVTDNPADVGGGSDQKADPNVPKEENMEEDENKDAGDTFKISAPILLLGAAAAFYFFYLRKKK